METWLNLLQGKEIGYCAQLLSCWIICTRETAWPFFKFLNILKGKKKEKWEQSNDHSNRNSRYFFFWIEGKSKPQFNTILAKSKYTFHTVLLTMELEIQVEEKRKIFYLSWILILRLRTIFLGLVLLSPIAEWWRWLLACDLKMKFYLLLIFLTSQEINFLISYVLKGDMTSCIIDFKERKELFPLEHSQ